MFHSVNAASQAGVQHAEHFLSRLDRLPRSEVDLALELYRDPELLRAVLDATTLPERVERVAISIDDPVQGPFLVITRSGHFVTCLGRGMRAGDLPIVTRGELDAISRKVTWLREKMALAKQLGGERGHAHLLRRLLVASDTVSREDFLAVAAWEPLLGPTFLELYLAMGLELVLQGPMLRTRRSRRAQDEEALHAYWDLLHATGHMALLGASTADREQYVSITDHHKGARAAFSYPLTGTGVVTFILKGAWAAARLGKLMLPDYKRALVVAQDAGKLCVDPSGDVQRHADLGVGGANSCGARNVDVDVEGPPRDDVAVGTRVALVGDDPHVGVRALDNGCMRLVEEDVEALAVSLLAFRLDQEVHRGLGKSCAGDERPPPAVLHGHLEFDEFDDVAVGVAHEVEEPPHVRLQTLGLGDGETRQQIRCLSCSRGR